MLGLKKEEEAVFKRLDTPQKIQDFLLTIPTNYEKRRRTFYSPRRMLREKKAHCLEGAVFAAAAFLFHGHEPLLLDLTPLPGDEAHVVALFKQRGRWGAISKTSHAGLRYRDPVYKTPRELALSYFHEYFLHGSGKKTLRSWGGPFNLKKFGTKWVTDEKNLWYIDHALDHIPHHPFLPPGQERHLRPADPIERRAAKLSEWKKSDRHT